MDFEKKEWETNDPIEADDLNRIEDALEDASDILDELTNEHLSFVVVDEW